MKLKVALDALENPPGDDSTIIIPWDPSAEPRSSLNRDTVDGSGDDGEPSIEELLAMSGSGGAAPIPKRRVCLPAFDRRSMSLGRLESFDLYEKMPADLTTCKDKKAEETDAAAASATASAEGGPRRNGSPLGGTPPPAVVSRFEISQNSQSEDLHPWDHHVLDDLPSPAPGYEMSAAVLARALRDLSTTEQQRDEDIAVEPQPSLRCPSPGVVDASADAVSEPASRCPNATATTGREIAGRVWSSMVIQSRRALRPRSPAPVANIGIKAPLVDRPAASLGFGGSLVTRPKTQQQPLPESPAKSSGRTKGKKVHAGGESIRYTTRQYRSTVG